ncbi:MAG: hypothetical protein EKK41_13260 [Hyphomicrobiales bacterium]|nr:MAG: hypothetical protein EKK41_13260 [Hyphomicrobiales bacterium]
MRGDEGSELRLQMAARTCVYIRSLHSPATPTAVWFLKDRASMTRSKFVGVGLFVLASVSVTHQSLAQAPAASPELAARMAKEKEDRKSCKLEICNAFAKPSTGDPITCAITKTWTKDEVLNRVVGGSYVWSYGAVQCSLKFNVDRSLLNKAIGEPKFEIAFPPHSVTCNVDDADAAKGKAFDVKVSFAPTFEFEKGEAKMTKLADVKTDGSGMASAAVSSLMAVDKISGIVGKAAASELNDLIYSKCKDDGVDIPRK